MNRSLGWACALLCAAAIAPAQDAKPPKQDKAPAKPAAKEDKPAAKENKPAADGDSGMGDYNAFRPEHVGSMKASTEGGGLRIKEMTGGVSIVLLSDNPEVKPLPLKSQSMKYNYKDGGSKPSTIVMDGGVVVKHPQADVSSDHAEWNFDTGNLTFSGNATMNSPGVENLKGSEIVLNMKTHVLEVRNMSANKVDPNAAGGSDTGGGGGAASGDLLSDRDVGDWPGLIGAIKAQAGSEKPSPGRQIYTKLNPQLQGPFMKLSASELVSQKGRLLKELNRILSSPGFYAAPAWEGIALNDEVKALLGKQGLGAEEQIRQNRLLLEAAYPKYFAAR